MHNPYTEEVIGGVPKATLEEVRAAFSTGHAYRSKLTRYERAAPFSTAPPISQIGAKTRWQP